MDGDSRGMAIFGPFSTVRAQSSADPRFAAAHRYVADLLDPNSAAYRRLNQIAVAYSEAAIAATAIHNALPRNPV